MGESLLSIRTRDFQLANELSEHFLLQVKDISDMLEKTPQSKSQLIPEFSSLSLTHLAEIKKEEILCIVRTVNKTNRANDPFNIGKMISEIISDAITTTFTDIVNCSVSTGVLPDSEKYAVVKPLL